MAIVYASNAKSSCYTGFTQIRPPRKNFNYLNFLAAQALPGPRSVTTCILQPQGPLGETRYLVLEKQTALSQVPGLRYGLDEMANLPRPASWDSHRLSEAVL